MKSLKSKAKEQSSMLVEMQIKVPKMLHVILPLRSMRGASRFRKVLMWNGLDAPHASYLAFG